MRSLVEPPRGALPQPELMNGCFETMRAYHGRIFRLADHLDRLQASAQFLGTRLPAPRWESSSEGSSARQAGLPAPPQALARQLTQALKRSGLKEAIVRIALMPQVRGPAMPSIVVAPVPLPPASAYRRGLHLAVVPARKFSVASINPESKYSARLGSILAVMDAQLRRVDEALFMDAMGSVTESTASNFGMVKHGELFTPPCWLGLLAGITRDVLVELAKVQRIPIHEVPLTRHDLYNADEAFLLSTIKEVMGVTRIDGRQIGSGHPGPMTKRLRQAFRQLVEQELGH